MKYRIEKYHPGFQRLWNQFVLQSFNATFLHHRAYMDYHADRFPDHSLIFFQGNEPVALLPAHRMGSRLYAHNGLTYGGWLWKKIFRVAEMEEMAGIAANFLKEAGVESLHIKEIPLFYWTYAGEQNRYVYNRKGRHSDTLYYWVIDTRRPFDTLFNADRRRSLRKAEKQPWKTEASDDWEGFWHLLEQSLSVRHGARPVHSLEEISMLAQRFPQQIKLFVVKEGERLLAGTVVYLTGNVLRFQYTAGSTDAMLRPAIDMLARDVMQTYYSKVAFVDWGPSENPGGGPNEGLIYWKQSLGAVPRAQYYWEFRL